MAEGNGSSNTAIVTILVIVLLILGILYYLGIFNTTDGNTRVTDHTRTTIEQPARTNTGAPSSGTADQRVPNPSR